MAKELPFFKFEPNAWENGNIQMLTREDKGLFIDICSMYWSRLGDLPTKLVTQKLCGGNATALDSLCEEKVIELIDGNIYIDFLSIQLQEFENTRSQNSENAKERWRKHREQKELCDRNASASNRQCETDAIREEKRREEEKRKDIFNFSDSLISLGAEKQLVKDWLAVRKNKKATNTETAFKLFKNQLDKSNLDVNFVLSKCIEKSWSGFNADWIKSTDHAPQNETIEEKALREHREQARKMLGL